MTMTTPIALELCAGAGGQALGLELAGFHHASAIEVDEACVATLRANRPEWNPVQADIRDLRGRDFRGIDLLAAGVPCPPFSIAGKQLGSDDERDLFPTTLRLVDEIKPRAVLIENVPGLATKRFTSYRSMIRGRLQTLGYKTEWQVLNASSYGVPQLRPRFILVALREKYAPSFRWPHPLKSPPTVGDRLADLMGARGWPGANRWARQADGIAPTLVGGSKKHGGPDLGPTRAKLAWKQLGVDGMGIADEAPDASFALDSNPRLTLRMTARIQGFPDYWKFMGRKTTAYRQVGNAFPPPVAFALGRSVFRTLAGADPVESPYPLPLALRSDYSPQMEHAW